MGFAAHAQSPAAATTATPAGSAAATTSAQPNSGMDVNDATTYATGQPLQPQSKEGF